MNKSYFSRCLIALCMVFGLFLVAACSSSRIDNCAIFNTDQNSCNQASLQDGGQCEYDEATKVCRPKNLPSTQPVIPPSSKRTLTYYDLTFESTPITTIVGQSGLTHDIFAIGRNGDGSRLYYGTATDVNYISSVDPNNLTAAAVHRQMVAPGANNTPGRAAFNTRTDAGLISSIVAGPSNRAIVSVMAVSSLGGLIEMAGSAIHGVWMSTNAHLSSGIDNRYITSVVTMGNKWMAFVNGNNTTGSHKKFGTALSLAAAGIKKDPGGGYLGVVINASAVRGDDLFLAFGVGRNNPVVVKNTIPKVAANRYRLNGNVNLDPAKRLITASDANLTPGIDNTFIIAMAVAGDYLLVGFDGSGGVGHGGVAVINVASTPPIVTKPIHNGWDIKHIGVSENGKSALISTDKGLLFFAHGKLCKMEYGVLKDITNLTASNANPAQPVAINGPIPRTLDLNHVGVGAVNIKDFWYIATDNNGVFRAKIEEKTKILP